MKKKKALVTGSAGFIGRHTVRELDERGYDVISVDTVYGIDASEIFRMVDDRYDIVVHAAYHVGGRVAIDGINQNFVKNLQLDASLFEWAVRTKQKHVLYFSSSAAYPIWRQQPCPLGCDPADIHCQEGPTILSEDMIDPHNAEEPDADYGWAKLTGERLAIVARRNGLSCSVVRPFSGYGGDQSLDYPFPSITSRASSGDLSVWGPPGQSRDWIHVDDVVRGALAVVESGTSEPVNLCTGRATEMGELMRMAYRAYPRMKTSVLERGIQYLEDKPTGVFYRVGNPERLKQFYTPKVSLEEGIDRALKGVG